MIYDVSLSFAGEDRAFAESLAVKLREKSLNVFYDKWCQPLLWGEDLYQLLAKIYSRQSRFIITILSENYMKKPWTAHELRFIQEHIFSLQDGSWLPIFLEDVNIPGLPKTLGILNAREYSVDEIANMVLAKVEATYTSQDIDDITCNDIKTMEILKENGEREVVEVLLTFSLEDTKKDYIIYTKNEYDDDGNVTIYSSGLDCSFDPPKMIEISDENEWERIQSIIQELAED